MATVSLDDVLLELEAETRIGLTGPEEEALSEALRRIEQTVRAQTTLTVLRFAEPDEYVEDLTIRRAASPALSRLAEIEREARQVQEARADPSANIQQLEEEYQQLVIEYDRLGGKQLRQQVHDVLYGLGFRGSDIRRPVAQLSDAELFRLTLARRLLTPCDVLLLDQPTRYLAPAAKRWLALMITSNAEMTVVVVSEDETFLGQVVDHRVSLTGSRLTRVSPSRRMPLPRIKPEEPKSAPSPTQPHPGEMDTGSLKLRVKETEQRFERVRDVLSRPDTYQQEDADQRIAALTEQHHAIEEELMALYQELERRQGKPVDPHPPD